MTEMKLNVSGLPPSSKALVAVSGGRDSVGLLQSLVDLEDISSLVVGHVNHRIIQSVNW